MELGTQRRRVRSHELPLGLKPALERVHPGTGQMVRRPGGGGGGGARERRRQRDVEHLGHQARDNLCGTRHTCIFLKNNYYTR